MRSCCQYWWRSFFSLDSLISKIYGKLGLIKCTTSEFYDPHVLTSLCKGICKIRRTEMIYINAPSFNSQKWPRHKQQPDVRTDKRTILFIAWNHKHYLLFRTKLFTAAFVDDMANCIGKKQHCFNLCSAMMLLRSVFAGDEWEKVFLTAQN